MVQGSEGRAQAPHGWVTELLSRLICRATALRDSDLCPSLGWGWGWRLGGSLAQVLKQSLQSLHAREHILLQPLLYGVRVEGQLQGCLQLLHKAVPPAQEAECLWLDVLDHDWVNKLPPAMVGTEPASDIPVPFQKRIHRAAQVKTNLCDEGMDVTAREGASSLTARESH